MLGQKEEITAKAEIDVSQFWSCKIVDAGNKSLSIQLLRSIAGLKEDDDDGFHSSWGSDGGGNVEGAAGARGEVTTFESVNALVTYISRFPDAVEARQQKRQPPGSSGSARRNDKTEKIHVLLNLMYAPRRSRLHSLAKTLARVENLSHICAWTRMEDPAEDRKTVAQLRRENVSTWLPSIDLVEFRGSNSRWPRGVRTGALRLFSVDHADLFVSNTRDTRAMKLLNGIPHSLILQNSQGEMHILVPVVKPTRPLIQTQPFTTRLVLERANRRWNSCLSQRYFLYPIHVSMSFLMTKGIDSALYLLLLRFLHREYAASFRLSDAVATDTGFSGAGDAIWRNLRAASHDFHPDAHAVRMKLSLVTIDSGSTLPWNLTSEAARYINKMSHVSAECRISRSEEFQILSSESIVLDRQSPAYDPKVDDLYLCTL